MKIIYRGGYHSNNADKSFFYEYAETVKNYIARGKNVVYVTFAKPEKLLEAKKTVEMIGIDLLLLKENEAKMAENDGKAKDFSIIEVLS